MKLFLLADARSEHTMRWTNALLEHDIEIFLFSISKIPKISYTNTKKLHFYSMNIGQSYFSKPDGRLSKGIYLSSVIRLRKLLKEYSPDIFHAHYASSYGLIGAVSGFHPYIISSWGSDIYNFPRRSIIHKKILKFTLSKADRILSTSRSMAVEIQKYSNRNIEVTPFGVDVNKFKPFITKSIFDSKDIVIGTIKSLEKRYGIEYLIKSFVKVKERFKKLNLKLLIVGGGVQERYLKKLTHDLGIASDIVFTGHINYDRIPEFHNMLDIYCALSVEESFGVAVLEACATEKPVIVSNAGGLPEIVEHQSTGLVVEKKNIVAAANAISILVRDEQLRKRLGQNGRKKVIKEYNWDDSVKRMISIYYKFTV
jgi:glycosyltransferase involved in cell wall biosynthesis